MPKIMFIFTYEVAIQIYLHIFERSNSAILEVSFFYLFRESSRFSVLLQLLRGSLASDVNVQPVEYGWRETIHRGYEQLRRHVEHLITITDEQLSTGRVPTENDIYDYKVDMDMKNVMELVENS